MGALEVEKVVYGHQPWRLISCIWLHAGVFHILANMLSLIFIGIRLEQEFGFGMHAISSKFIFKIQYLLGNYSFSLLKSHIVLILILIIN